MHGKDADMSGTLHGLDDFLAIMQAYNSTWDQAARLEYLKRTERMFDDLLGFAQKTALAGYGMREWRRRLFIPFGGEFNGLVTNYSEAIEMAQRGLIVKRTTGRRLVMGYNPGYTERNEETNRKMENAYYREWES